MTRVAPVKAFAAVAVLGLSLAGCASMPKITDKTSCMDTEENNFGVFGSISRTYNRTCAVNNAAEQMAVSSDPGLRAVGTRVLADVNPEIQAKVQEVNLEMKPEAKRTYSCSASKIETMPDGSRKVRLGACTHQ